jgi:hypothetical protein
MRRASVMEFDAVEEFPLDISVIPASTGGIDFDTLGFDPFGGEAA